MLIRGRKITRAGPVTMPGETGMPVKIFRVRVRHRPGWRIWIEYSVHNRGGLSFRFFSYSRRRDAMRPGQSNEALPVVTGSISENFQEENVVGAGQDALLVEALAEGPEETRRAKANCRTSWLSFSRGRRQFLRAAQRPGKKSSV